MTTQPERPKPLDERELNRIRRVGRRMDDIPRLLATIDHLQAENERFRAVLEAIQHGPTYIGIKDVDQYMDTQYVRRYLKAALKTEE